MDLIMLFKITPNLVALDFWDFFGLTIREQGVTITNLLILKAITMHASFRLLVDELTHGTIYTLTW